MSRIELIDEAIISRFERWLAHPIIDYLGVSLLWQWRIVVVCWLAVTVTNLDWMLSIWCFVRCVELMAPIEWGSPTPTILATEDKPNPKRFTERGWRLFGCASAVVFSPIAWARHERDWYWFIGFLVCSQIEGCNPREPGTKIRGWLRMPMRGEA